ncbi:hypothetical protein [Rhodothermus marinus]|nr:hypothetical protein [Rhodothermus marinus]
MKKNVKFIINESIQNNERQKIQSLEIEKGIDFTNGKLYVENEMKEGGGG